MDSDMSDADRQREFNEVRNFLDYILRTGNELTDDLSEASLEIDATPIDEELRQRAINRLTHLVCGTRKIRKWLIDD